MIPHGGLTNIASKLSKLKNDQLELQKRSDYLYAQMKNCDLTNESNHAKLAEFQAKKRDMMTEKNYIDNLLDEIADLNKEFSVK